MIYEITFIFIAVSGVLAAVQRFDIPAIPVYIATGFLSGIVLEGFGRGLPTFDDQLLQNMVYLGLGLVTFYATTRFKLDGKRSTSIDSFKSSIYVSLISFVAMTGLAVISGLPMVESVLIGILGAFGSTLVNSKVVDEEIRENHVHGWLTEDLGFYQDIIAVISIVIVFTHLTGVDIVFSLSLSALMIASALLARRGLSKGFLKLQDDNEIVLLAGISTFVGLTLLAEQYGLTAITGILASGILLADTKLGFKVRERLSSIKDFFAALSFFAIGLLIDIPDPSYVGISVALIIFVILVRPLIILLSFYVQGFDLRTSYLAGFEVNEVSEISILGVLVLTQFVSDNLVSAAVVAFGVTMVISHLTDSYSRNFFDRYLSRYEFEPERENLPIKFEDHIIIAGFDTKTENLVNLFDDDVIVVDYDLGRIERAEEMKLFHVLGDLYSERTWDKLRYRDAKMIVSAVSDKRLLERIDSFETDAEIVSAIDEDREDIDQKLQEMLREKLEEIDSE